MASLPLSVSAEKISSVSKAAEALINLSAGRNSVVLSRPDADQQSQEWDRVSHLFENPPTIPHTQKISCGDEQNNSNSTSTAQIRRWRSNGEDPSRATPKTPSRRRKTWREMARTPFVGTEESVWARASKARATPYLPRRREKGRRREVAERSRSAWARCRKASGR